MVGGWVLGFRRLMLISTQAEVVFEVGVDLGNLLELYALKYWFREGFKNQINYFHGIFRE